MGSNCSCMDDEDISYISSKGMGYHTLKDLKGQVLQKSTVDEIVKIFTEHMNRQNSYVMAAFAIKDVYKISNPPNQIIATYIALKDKVIMKPDNHQLAKELFKAFSRKNREGVINDMNNSDPPTDGDGNILDGEFVTKKVYKVDENGIVSNPKYTEVYYSVDYKSWTTRSGMGCEVNKDGILVFY